MVNESIKYVGTGGEITVVGPRKQVELRVSALRKQYPFMPYDGHVAEIDDLPNGDLRVVYKWRSAD